MHRSLNTRAVAERAVTRCAVPARRSVWVTLVATAVVVGLTVAVVEHYTLGLESNRKGVGHAACA